MAISKMPKGRKGKKRVPVPTATPTRVTGTAGHKASTKPVSGKAAQAISKKHFKGEPKYPQAKPNIVTKGAIKLERALTRKKRYGGKGQRHEDD